MQPQREEARGPDTLYLAGEQVGPGIYKQVDGSRVVYLGKVGTLPASLDGQVACYRRLQSPPSEEKGA